MRAMEPISASLNAIAFAFGNGSWGRVTKWALPLAITFASLLSLSAFANAQKKYDPEHPEVRAMVDQGVAYMRTRVSSDVGGQLIEGLAILNSYQDLGFRQDAAVISSVDRALGLAGQYRSMLANDFQGNDLNGSPEDFARRMYEPCVALMLLVEFDDVAYEAQIRTLIDFIVARRMPGGGWSYNRSPNIDTSQTQYCCLALWLANEKGFDIPLSHAQAAAKFWISAQAQDGSWGYQVVPGQRQGSQHMSLVSAGAGSLYMLGDILNVNPPKKARAKRSDDSDLELPPFVERLTKREIETLLAEQASAAPEPEMGINVEGFNGAKARANQWYGQNFEPNTVHWPYYALYGFERYASFREKIDGDVTEVPDWYDQGIEYLKTTQSGNGSFPGSNEANASIQTAFAVLFMVRSTQRLTALARDATLAGGQGLGGNVSTRGGKVISEQEKKDIAELLSRVKKEMSAQELEDIAESFRNVAVNSIKDKSKAQQLTLLREMVTNEHWQIRMVAVRALGQVRLVDNCAALIYALSDPDPRIVQEANIALKFVSRKTETPAVPVAKVVNGRSDVENQQYRADIRKLYGFWSEWYLELKPDAELLPVELK